MQQQNIMETKLARITEISKERPKEVFTSIYHFLNKDLLMLYLNLDPFQLVFEDF